MAGVGGALPNGINIAHLGGCSMESTVRVLSIFATFHSSCWERTRYLAPYIGGP